MDKIITLHAGSEHEKNINIRSLEIPDLWHLAMDLRESSDKRTAEMVLECWYMAHALKQCILDHGEAEAASLADHDKNQLSLLSA